jgi:hypothetical protein
MDEQRVIDAMIAGIEPAEKVKAFVPQIIVYGIDEKPYYSISYYDVEKRVWYIGYGSYNIDFVRHWLSECFEEVEVDMVPVVRCKDCKHRGNVDECPMCYSQEYEFDEGDGYMCSGSVDHDNTHDDGFCDKGEGKTNGQ